MVGRGPHQAKIILIICWLPHRPSRWVTTLIRKLHQQVKELTHFLHGFLLHLLERLPKGRSAALRQESGQRHEPAVDDG
jgi:hypothetical protein